MTAISTRSSGLLIAGGASAGFRCRRTSVQVLGVRVLALRGLPPPDPRIGLNGLVLKRRTGWVSPQGRVGSQR